MNRLALGLALALALSCTTTGEPEPVDPPRGDGFAAAYTLDERTLILSFTRKLKADTVSPGAFSAWDRTVVPGVQLAIEGANASGDAEATISTAPQEVGRSYTLTISGLKDENGFSLDGTLNFVGGGIAQKARVTFTVADGERARAWGMLGLELTVDPASGEFSERSHPVTLQPAGTGLSASVDVVVNPRRTLARGDDADPLVDRRAYAVRVVSGVDAASPLVPFEVLGAAPLDVVLPLLEPPVPTMSSSSGGYMPPVDPNPGDGLKRIRIIVDDRAPRELTAPAVKCSFDAQGNFDVSFPQQLTLGTPGEPRLYEVEASVKVDPNRRLDGTTEDTLPYIITLFNAGTDVEAINLSVVAPDETPEAVVLPLGDATMTPVTFRVDAAAAFLVADGSQRGVFASESVFLTGEWQRASDALGRNAGDAFSGGEQLTLQMKEDPDRAGLWFKTLWLPPGRPYGWKVVRCRTGEGCGPLNQRVASSGRAFATVMKNLATHNLDAFAAPEVVIVDPANLGAVPLASGSTNYSGASVYIGNGMGGEGNPAGIPRGDTLFKQEVPDLAVVVGDTPIVTPIFVVGTWRDVNLPVRPEQILQGGSVVALAPYDYDEGFIGRYPPQRSTP